MSNPVRTILCEFDTNAGTFTFKECNYETQDPGPYDERSCAYFSSTPQTYSRNGAMVMLGQIISAGTIQGLSVAQG